MIDEPGLPPKKTMLIGETTFEITDPLQIDPVFADLYTECRLVAGVVHISLAAGIMDANNQPEMRIVARLRLPLFTLDNIRASVQDIIDRAEEAKKASN